MKKNLMPLLLLVFCHTCSNIDLQAQSKTQLSDFVAAMNQLIDSWTKPTEDIDIYEEAHTWLPDLGIRGRYHLNQKLLSLAQIAQIIGEPIFESGPHETKIEFNATEFGFYNADFLKKLNKFLAKAFKDKTFRNQAEAFYQKELKNYLHSYWDTYRYINSNKKQKATWVLEAKNIYFVEGDLAGYTQQLFWPLADAYEKTGNNAYELTVCGAFWLRRCIDETETEFYNLLRTVIGNLEPSYIKAATLKSFEEEEESDK